MDDENGESTKEECDSLRDIGRAESHSHTGKTEMRLTEKQRAVAYSGFYFSGEGINLTKILACHSLGRQ